MDDIQVGTNEAAETYKAPVKTADDHEDERNHVYTFHT